MADTTPDLAKQSPSIRTVTGWTVFFLVLLRICIGWHFAYEGAWKLKQDDWRATGYLTQSIGPLRPVFLKFVDDPDGLQRLTPESVKSRTEARYERLTSFYGFSESQREPLKKMKDALIEGVDATFANPDFKHQLENYKEFLGEVAEQEKALFQHDKKTVPGDTPFNSERWVYNCGKKASARQALLARVEGPIHAIENAILDARTVEQMGQGSPPHEKSQTFFSDWANMIGLTAVGVCLMLGLFTRLASLGGIGLLCLYYFCMPPWPGLPEGPSEGHYLYINKNVIEAVALLVIATSGVGRWAGLDGIIHGRRCRRRCKAAQA